MSQFVTPDGFELVAFIWDRFPDFVEERKGTSAGLAGALSRIAPLTRRTEEHGIEEELERWDGLS